MTLQKKNGQGKVISLVKKPKNPNEYNLFIVIATLLLIFTAIFTLQGGITGRFAAGEYIEYNQSLSLNIDSPQTLIWNLEHHPKEFNLRSVELSGKYRGEGTVKVYMESESGQRFLILDSNLLEPEHLESITGYAVAGDGGGDSGSDSDGGTSGGSSGDSSSSSSGGSSSSDSGGDSSSSGSHGSSSGDSGSSTGSSSSSEGSTSDSSSSHSDSAGSSDSSSSDSSDSGDSASDSTSGSESSEDTTISDDSGSESDTSDSADSDSSIDSPNPEQDDSSEESQDGTEEQEPTFETPVEDDSSEESETIQTPDESQEPVEEISPNDTTDSIDETTPEQTEEPEETVPETEPEQETPIEEPEEILEENITEPSEDIELDLELPENMTEEPEENKSIETDNLTLPEIPELILDNITIINESIMNNTIENITEVNLTEMNLTLVLNETLNLTWTDFDFNEICAETCLLPEGLNESSYSLIFEFEGDAEVEVDTIHYSLVDLSPETIEVNLDIKDHLDNLIDAQISITSSDFSSTIRNGETLQLLPGLYDITVTPEVTSLNNELPIRSITFSGVSITEPVEEFLDFEFIESPSSSDFTQQYAFHPLLEYNYASATVLANNSELYRCDSWNFDAQVCPEGWNRLDSITPEQEYLVEIHDFSHSYAEGFNVTNISYLKIKEDSRYDAIIDSVYQDPDSNDLTVQFHHDSESPLPIFIKGKISYILDKNISSAGETVSLIIPNWNNERFRILIGSHTEAFEFGVPKEVVFSSKVKDASGTEQDSSIELIDSLTDNLKSKKSKGQDKPIPEGEYNIKAKLQNHPVKEIEYYDLEIYQDFTENIRIDDVPEFGSYVQVYAIDPTNLNFTEATVTVTATGTELYKCKDWDFTTQTCSGTWELFMTGLIPGQDYTFTLTPEDPGFAEIDSLTGFGTFNTTADFNAWTHIGADADGDFVHDTTTYRLGGGSLRAQTTVGRNKNWATDYMNRSTTSIEAGSEVTLNWSWRKSYVSAVPDLNTLYIDLVTPSQSVNTVWTNSDATWNTWTDESLNISSYITETGPYEVRLRIELDNPNDAAAQTLAWFDEVFVYVREEIIDETVPASVTDLANQSADPYSIYWNWTNPTDEDFNSTIIYIDGVNVANLSAPINYYNATGLEDETSYTITVHTMDHSGNVNNTDVNSIATTPVCGIKVNNISHAPEPVTQGNIINFTANVTSIMEVDTVLIEIEDVNYTMVNTSQDIWTYSYNTSSLTPSIYTYFVNANCSEGYWATTKNSSFTVQEAETPVNITSIEFSPDDDEVTPGAQINPIEDSNVTITLIANITNSTLVESCEVRIYNATGSIPAPTLEIQSGTIQVSSGQTQCNASWPKEYWRNIGNWSVTVTANTSSDYDQETSTYYYNALVAHELSTATISYSGLPLQTVNSSDAYPLTVRNTGNQVINISLSGSDFIGQSNESYSIGVGNASYSETESGFTALTTIYQQIYTLEVQQTKEIYFRGYMPSGVIAQDYQSNINIRSD